VQDEVLNVSIDVIINFYKTPVLVHSAGTWANLLRIIYASAQGFGVLGLNDAPPNFAFCVALRDRGRDGVAVRDRRDC